MFSFLNVAAPQSPELFPLILAALAIACLAAYIVGGLLE